MKSDTLELFLFILLNKNEPNLLGLVSNHRLVAYNARNDKDLTVGDICRTINMVLGYKKYI